MPGRVVGSPELHLVGKRPHIVVVELRFICHLRIKFKPIKVADLFSRALDEALNYLFFPELLLVELLHFPILFLLILDGFCETFDNTLVEVAHFNSEDLAFLQHVNENLVHTVSQPLLVKNVFRRGIERQRVIVSLKKVIIRHRKVWSEFDPDVFAGLVLTKVKIDSFSVRAP